jgi:pantoate--beta-alanine ligase
MGALHDGHASLVKRSVIENDVTVVSIFVNPTQFNDKNDLENYPHTLEADCQLLDNLGVQLVFAPSVEEIYPVPDQRTFSFPPVDEVMEGKFRPGHFNGVCQIVSKLFQIVEPDNAYFGEKDFQQIAVIRAMVKSLAMKVNIVSYPIVRESDGLALSSRNTLLKPDERAIAVNISKYLFESVEYSQSHTLQETRSFVIDHINTVSGLRVQYFEIVDGSSLRSLDNWSESDYIVGCITVFCGETPIRLIDNIQYKHP